MIKTDQTEQGKVCKAKVPFIEHVMMKNGIKADQRKSDATIKMERPTDVSAVQRLLVLVK